MRSKQCQSLDSLRETPVSKERRGFTLLELILVIIILLVAVALFLPNVRRAREAAPRSQCRNNLKQIGLALLNYNETYGVFPPAYTIDAGGKPLHSWRTLILPFIEEQQLYEQIDLSKPWDDPANLAAYSTVPPVYRCPSFDPPPNHTTYQAVVSPDSFFRSTETRSLSEIQAVSTRTIMVIETDPGFAVHWMAPRDADEQFLMGFGPETQFAHTGGTQALFLDGHVEFLSAQMTADERRAMISVVEGEREPAENEQGDRP